jgi:adenylate cyclase
MGKEIERKFLLRHNGWRMYASLGVRMRQGYLNGNGLCSIRVRIAGEQAHLNIKSATLDLSRMDFDYPIPLEDAEQILDQLCLRPLIEKTRYRVEHAGHLWEIDVFEGENKGLIVAELELEDADEPFELPDWVGEEVSADPRYYNVCLVKHPYKDWDSGNQTANEVEDLVRPSALSWVLVAISWTLVGVPLAWGILKTLENAAPLFR